MHPEPIDIAGTSYYDISELSAHIGVAVRTIKSLGKRGKFPIHRIGKKFLVSVDAFDAYIKNDVWTPKPRGAGANR